MNYVLETMRMMIETLKFLVLKYEVDDDDELT